MLSAIINIVINITFIKWLGIYAACISTFIAYFVMMIYRIYDIKKYIKLTFDIRKNIILLIMLLIATILYFVNNKIILVILLIIEIPMLYVLNISFIKDFENIFLKKKKVNIFK